MLNVSAIHSPAPPLAALCDLAGVRLRHQPQSEALFEALLPVIQTLLEMRRAGLLTAIWVDDFKLRIQYAGSRERVNVDWRTAERLAEVFVERKPVQVETVKKA